MKYDIAALKRKMLVKYPFFGSVVASVGYKENKDIPTAGTDGETIYYNPKYLESFIVTIVDKYCAFKEWSMYCAFYILKIA